jgi:NADPH2:quinone reductase
MLAVVATQFGSPAVLVPTVIPDPVPGPGQAVIDVDVADVLWVETMVRSGAGVGYFALRPPYVPGDGVAGRVRAVGSEVDAAWIGRRVLTQLGGSGGYAEQAVAAVSDLIVIPPEVSQRDAAALRADGQTALALFEGTRIGRGDRVLVLGASGGLGIVSLQLARARGARVVAVARDPRKIARLGELGADAVIDSASPGWIEQARAALGGVGADVVLDNIGGAIGEAAFALCAPGGRFSAHGTPSGRFANIDHAEAARRNVSLRGIGDVQLGAAERQRLITEALAEAAAGHIAPVVGQTFPLAEAAAAHAAIEGREVFGKTLLLI